MHSRSKRLINLALKDKVAVQVEESLMEEKSIKVQEPVTVEESVMDEDSDTVEESLMEESIQVKESVMVEESIKMKESIKVKESVTVEEFVVEEKFDKVLSVHEKSTNTFLSRKITILQEKTAVLDDKTGKIVFIDRELLLSNALPFDQPSCSSNSILDEKTGQLISQDIMESDSNFSESDFSFSGSNYSPSECSSDTETSLSSHNGPSRILNETSGVVKIKRARKGMGNTKNWARNRLKLKRMKGEEYVSIKRKKNEGSVGVESRKKRTLQERCDSEKCASKFSKKCNKITNKDRKAIFDSFWNLNWDERKAYVVAMVTLKPVNILTKGIPSRRVNTLEYALKVGGKAIPVCKKMFCHTLCLGEWTVTNWVKRTKSSDIGMSSRNKPVKRIKPINLMKIDHITTFLNALPKMPSHYCRQTTSKEYVDVNFTTWAQVYTEFTKYLKDNNISDIEKPTYKCFLDVIHKKNLSIYRPKKDQCDLCYSYKNKNVSEEEYQKHIKDRDRARKEKEEDKSKCLNGEIHMLTVDLQAVQSIPMISAGAQYFKLKLSVHQFTIYNEHDKSVSCYVWHEGEGGMEANVFTSCLIDYLEHLEDKTKTIIIYSDGCNAQNRNTTLSNALQHFALKFSAEIQQKYLVVGHTQMECDSVHATIERKKKGKELYVPADFLTVIRQARVSEPYKVKYLNHEFFHSFASLNYLKSIRPGFRKGDPCVVDLKALKYTPQIGVQYKLDFDEDWSLLPHRLIRQYPMCGHTIPKLYNQPLPITKRKYEDLRDMKQLIPADYHSFYDNLVHD